MEKLYITIEGEPVKLNPFDAKIAAAIKSDIEAGSVVFELKSSYWSGSATNLPDNAKAVYISGSQPNIPVPGYSGVALAGQVAVFREQNGQPKSISVFAGPVGQEQLVLRRGVQELHRPLLQRLAPNRLNLGKAASEMALTMNPDLHDNIWISCGTSLLWDAAALNRICPFDSVRSLRELLRLRQASWPDDSLKLINNRTLVVAGLEAAMDTLHPDAAVEWLEQTVYQAISDFQRRCCRRRARGRAHFLARRPEARFPQGFRGYLPLALRWRAQQKIHSDWPVSLERRGGKRPSHHHQGGGQK